MIEGHGDDLYRYGGRISMNFSSNIYYGADLTDLKAHLAAHLDTIASYPEPHPAALERLIAERNDIDSGCVMVTAGATEAIYLVAQAMRRIARYAVRRPTFCEYDDACRMFGYAETGYEEATQGEVLRWICCPNNPTGEVFDPYAIAETAARGGITVVDRSYEDYTLAPFFSAREALGLPNVVMLHSMTKTYAVPGLRLGYITAPPEIIGKIRRCARPWAVNALAIEAGTYLITRSAPTIPDLCAHLADAAALRNALNGLPDISVRPTATNFMLAEMAVDTAAELKEYLATRHGMLIRDCANIAGLSPRHFRVAARSREDNSLLVEAIKEYLREF